MFFVIHRQIYQPCKVSNLEVSAKNLQKPVDLIENLDSTLNKSTLNEPLR